MNVRPTGDVPHQEPIPVFEEATVDFLTEAFERDGYICDENIIVPVYLALRLQKPLLIEGMPGVGKTEIAKVISRVFKVDLIRLQCYEGLDENKALYEWNYQRQLLRIEMAKVKPEGDGPREYACERDLFSDLFSEEYLLERPLLRAIRSEERVVLLIDEIDRTDEEFEAFLFEVLSDFQVSIPELGTLKARFIPAVVLTSNRSRDLSDALKRRCLFLYIDYPTIEKEYRIIRAKVPYVSERLASQVATAVSRLRNDPEVRKKPSIAESIDWAKALVCLEADSLDPSVLKHTLNLVLKNREDFELYKKKEKVASLL
ncbi:MAG TPA: MoxR family ATPase [Clostridia bacterium]|nr:MoxR family ATPase [Clostridia bacterium]